jgi:hypothetical protein
MMLFKLAIPVFLISFQLFSTDSSQSNGKNVLIIGEGHKKIMPGGSMLLNEGSLNFHTPSWEDHSNPDAICVDFDRSLNPDIQGVIKCGVDLLEDKFFDEIYDARALFNKGINNKEDQTIIESLFQHLSPGGKFEFQFDPLFEIDGLGQRINVPISYNRFLSGGLIQKHG